MVRFLPFSLASSSAIFPFPFGTLATLIFYMFFTFPLSRTCCTCNSFTLEYMSLIYL
jgi:hypothetical protein